MAGQIARPFCFGEKQEKTIGSRAGFLFSRNQAGQAFLPVDLIPFYDIVGQECPTYLLIKNFYTAVFKVFLFFKYLLTKYIINRIIARTGESAIINVINPLKTFVNPDKPLLILSPSS